MSTKNNRPAKILKTLGNIVVFLSIFAFFIKLIARIWGFDETAEKIVGTISSFTDPTSIFFLGVEHQRDKVKLAEKG